MQSRAQLLRASGCSRLINHSPRLAINFTSHTGKASISRDRRRLDAAQSTQLLLQGRRSRKQHGLAHAWLSAARLEPALVYEYALVFARNELEADDVAYFDHEFLHSMGVSVAKHRLEILKLAWRDRRHPSLRPRKPHQLPGLLDRVARYVRSLVRLRRDEGGSTALVLVPSQQYPDVDDRAGGSKRRRGKALRRAASEPKGSTSRSVGGRGSATAAVHADNRAGDGEQMIRWDSLFQDLKPN